MDYEVWNGKWKLLRSQKLGSGLKLCDSGTLIQLLCFRVLSIVLFFFNLRVKQRFGDWIISPSSDKKPTNLGTIDRTCPYLRMPAPARDRIYKSSTPQTICES